MNEIDSKDLLLVEDNPNDLELALHALAKANLAHRVRVARDGAEALDIIFSEGAHASRTIARPKVILLDLKLPKVTGHEVLKRIKTDPRTRAIPVILLTSSQEQIDIAKGYDFGANSYVAKPVNFEQFVDAVHELGLYWLLRNVPPPPAE